MDTVKPGERIRDDLRKAIADGYYRPGQQLPSIRSLMQQYDVANATVQRVLDKLRYEGLIEGRAGSGLFVREATDTKTVLQHEHKGRHVEDRVSVRKATHEDAATAGVAAGSPVLVITSTGGDSVHTTVLPAYRSELVYQLPAK